MKKHILGMIIGLSIAGALGIYYSDNSQPKTEPKPAVSKLLQGNNNVIS